MIKLYSTSTVKKKTTKPSSDYQKILQKDSLIQQRTEG